MNDFFQDLNLSEPYLIEVSEWIAQTPEFKNKKIMTSDVFLDLLSEVLSKSQGQYITVSMWDILTVYFDSVRISSALENAEGHCYVELKTVPNDYLWWEQVRIKNPAYYKLNKK